MQWSSIVKIILIILQIIAILSLIFSIYIGFKGFVGWGDVIAIIFLFFQLGITLISLPIIYKLNTSTALSQSYRSNLMLSSLVILLLSITLLIVLAINDLSNPILWLIVIIVNGGQNWLVYSGM